LSGGRQISWLFFKAIRAGLAVKRPYLRHTGRVRQAPDGKTALASVQAPATYSRFGDRPKEDESHFGGTGVRGDDLPAAGELLEIHRGISHHLLVGTREIDRPPGEGECEIWF
jgi:hypothetical protein